jgi:hypothetical protein
MIKGVAHVRVISKADRDRSAIDAEIRRHEIALGRALNSLRRESPLTADLVIDGIAQRILLTKNP